MDFWDFENIDIDSFLNSNINMEEYYENYYRALREDALKRIFEDYPDMIFKKLTISFSINNNSKNAPLVYSVIEHLPKELYVIDKNNVDISINSEKEIIDYKNIICDLLTVVKSWKSLNVKHNNSNIVFPGDFDYFLDVIFDHNKLENKYWKHTIPEIRKTYYSKKRTTKKEMPAAIIPISRNNPTLAFSEVIKKYIELYGKNKNIVTYEVSEHDIVINIEDSLIVDFRLVPRSWRRLNDEKEKDWNYPYIMIQELTHNELYKFNFAGFKRCFKFDYIGIQFFAFHGLDYYVSEIDNFNNVAKALPGLKLKERYDNFPGTLYHYILLRIEDNEGNIVFGIGNTQGKVHSFVLKLCKELEEKNSRSLELNGASCLPFDLNIDFVKAFLSWKGQKKRWRLEEKFTYYYEDELFKNDSDAYVRMYDILEAAQKGKYNEYEFGNYNKPLNRWKSEEQVYNIVKKLYKDYQVVYQYRPYFLSTERGNMSYDVYICGLKIAVEYQGKQHFEPVDYFGGVENFNKQKERDHLKAERSKQNGVKLVYINYWDDITVDTIKNRINEVINN